MSKELLAQARDMAWTDPPLVAYLAAPNPEPHTSARQPLVDGEGHRIGSAVVTRRGKGHSIMWVVATIEGRKFHGTTPTFSGTYCRLRPYRPTKETP